MRKTKGFRLLALALALTMVVPNVTYAAKTSWVSEHKSRWDNYSQDATTTDTELETVASEETDVDTLDAALTEAKTYIDKLTINNSSNDPATVVSKYGTHFTWDNEDRESGKPYLYDWSYYNGVVFEGLEYVYEITGEDVYKDYVVEYMSSLIDADGEWATCSNNSSKECAGYVDDHGADCYKTASLLLDTYEMTKDERYLKIAEVLYEDLDEAANSYLLSKAGYNYRHTWSSDPSPDLWLDGLYMILPFRAEYAKYTNDTEELDLIVDRMQWVSDNMYNSQKGWFYHAADSASSNSGTYWLRAIGWYAAAIVDIMDSMDGNNLEEMKAQLVKLVDGMKSAQNASNGMWLNNLNAKQSSTNPYETSGTALICYAVMKAVNEGWLDASYADMAILAFEGICNEKLSGTILTDICFKGAPGSGNSTFYDNEGKGVGPFIMLYAEVMEYQNKQTEEPEEPVEPEVPEVSEDEKVTVEETEITVSNVTDLKGDVVTEEDKDLIDAKTYTNYVAYDISATLVEGTKALISIPVPAEWNATEDELTGISVENGEVKEIEGTLSENGVYSFEVDHFSGKGVAYTAMPAADTAMNTGTGYLEGSKVYTLDTNGVTANKDYLIVNSSSSGTRYALTNNNGSAGRTEVTVSNNTITYKGDTNNIDWQFSGSTSGTSATSSTVGNNGRYVYPNNGSLSLNNNSTNLNVKRQNNSGAYRIYRFANSYYYYLTYSNNNWTGARTRQENSVGSVYLYEHTSTNLGGEVVFTILPEALMIAPNAPVSLDSVSVTVAGGEVDLDDCTIVWASTEEEIIAVDGSTVTGIADGTAYVTATLSAVDGTALKENIELRIPVTVQSKKVINGVLIGNDPVTTKHNIEPDFGNIKLEVTYDDGTTGIITVDNGLVIEGYDITTIGWYYATISYEGVEYGTVRVTVEGNPYAGLEDATVYPEYPADGAVRIDKTATHNADEFKNTGVTHVELSVAGISVKRGVDVVLVADISNSMAWYVGASGTSDANKIATGTQTTKWDEIQKSAETFVDVLFEGQSGEEMNTVSFVTFGGYDAERNNNSDSYDTYADSVQTHFTSYTDGEVAKAIINQLEIRGENSGGTVTYTITGMNQGTGVAQGGTNYDYAFLETGNAINQIKADYAAANGGASYDESGREIYVVFMTDGAPDHYNQLYYKTRSTSQFDYYALYKNSTDTFLDKEYFATHNLPTYKSFVQRQKPNGYYIPTSDLTNANWIDWIQKDSLYVAEQVAAMNGVNSITAIGFDLANGGFGNFTFGDAVLEPVLKNLAGEDSCNVYLTSDAYELNRFYENLATQIKFAGTSAQVTDEIDSEFTLQMAASSGSGDHVVALKNAPGIKVTAYDLYTKTDKATDSAGNDLTGERKGTSTVMEAVTFNTDGTEAYSDQADNGQTNIMTVASDGTVIIEAFYFTYMKTPEGIETFQWKIGNITDKEVVLGFDVYLKGALEGEAEKGTYYTNEEAVLEYIDINEKYAKQIFDVPHVNWGGASTTIRFYLVNEKGEPVNHAGEVIPWANRIYIGESVNVTLNLNADMTIPAQKIEAAAYVPGEYFLYDQEAFYTVQTASGESIQAGITVSEPSEDAFKTTYDDYSNPTTQTGAQTTKLIIAEENYYTWSIVGFGVRYDLSKEEITPLNPDVIVMDYGKDIRKDILANDTEVIETGWTAELVGFVKYNANTDIDYIQANPGSPTYTANYGQFSVVDSKVVNYKLNKMLSAVEKVFCVIKFTEDNNTNNIHYRYNVLNIVPAPEMYYEDDFAGAIKYTANEANPWVEKTGVADSTAALQDDGTVGQNKAYGFDTSYNDDATYSNGTAISMDAKTGDGYNITYATFTFTGTGFDLISYTSPESGMIRAEIFKGTEVGTKSDIYKYAQVANVGASQLYQIPVLSCEDMEYDTYTVRVHVYEEYKNEVLPALNRGGYFVFDALRIYDPIDVSGTIAEKSDAEIAQAAYLADKEAFDKHFEVREAIVSAADFDATTAGTDGDGVVYIDASADSNTDANPEATVVDYTADGPNNETYFIDKSTVVGFVLNVEKIPTSIQIGAKSVLGTPVMLDMFIVNPHTITEEYDGDTAFLSTPEFSHATAQNYSTFENVGSEKVEDFTPYFAECEDGTYQAYVYIGKFAGEGTTDSILSVTDFKATFEEESDMWVTYNTGLVEAYSLRNQASEDGTESVNVELYSAAFKKSSVRYTNQATLEVETTDNVDEIVIINEAGKIISADTKVKTKDGVSVWTLKFKPGNVGIRRFVVYGVAEDGTETERATVSIEATRR